MTESDGPLERYHALLQEVALRVDIAVSLLRSNTLGIFPRVHASAVELRAVLELIAYSGALTHRERIDTLSSALRKKEPGQIRATVRAINPNWWPEPVVDADLAWGPDSEGPRVVEARPAGDWLTEEEWGPAFGRTSDLIHARNPFRDDRIIPEVEANWLLMLSDRIVNLLTHHTIELKRNELLIALVMPPPPSGVVSERVQVWKFSRQGPD